MEEKIIRPTTKPEAIKGKLLKYQGTDYNAGGRSIKDLKIKHLESLDKGRL